MPDTVEAFGVFLLAILPGALYVWSFERVVGRWGIGLADRLFRFAAASAVFLAIFAAPLYYLRAEFVHHRVVDADDRIHFVNRVSDGEDLPWWLFAVPLAYVFIPAVAGTGVGHAVAAKSARWKSVGRVLVGRDPAPRAWDFLFSSTPSAVLRIKLKDGGAWLGGFFGESSYAAGYPEEPQDLFLEETYAMNQEDGSFVRDGQGRPVKLGSAVLLRWDEVLLVEGFRLEEVVE